MCTNLSAIAHVWVSFSSSACLLAPPVCARWPFFRRGADARDDHFVVPLVLCLARPYDSEGLEALLRSVKDSRVEVVALVLL